MISKLCCSREGVMDQWHLREKAKRVEAEEVVSSASATFEVFGGETTSLLW